MADSVHHDRAEESKVEANRYRDKSINMVGAVFVGVFLSGLGAFLSLLGSKTGKRLFYFGLFLAFGAGAFAERFRAEAAELEVEHYYDRYRASVAERQEIVEE